MRNQLEIYRKEKDEYWICRKSNGMRLGAPAVFDTFQKAYSFMCKVRKNMTIDQMEELAKKINEE